MTLPPASPSEPRISAAARLEIKRILDDLLDALIAGHDPATRAALDVLATQGRREKPFLYALFPGLAHVSAIERSFSSSMGNRYENIARAIARGEGLRAETQYRVVGRVSAEVIGHIAVLTRENRSTSPGNRPPNLTTEIETIDNVNTGPKAEHQVIIDLFVQSADVEYYFDLKTPQPNSKQSSTVKERLLKARAFRLPKSVNAHAVFYYNPRGTAGLFREGAAYFDYAAGEVLVGRAFWDLIGGSGTYDALLGLFQEVGHERSPELAKLLG